MGRVARWVQNRRSHFPRKITSRTEDRRFCGPRLFPRHGRKSQQRASPYGGFVRMAREKLRFKTADHISHAKSRIVPRTAVFAVRGFSPAMAVNRSKGRPHTGLRSKGERKAAVQNRRTHFPRKITHRTEDRRFCGPRLFPGRRRTLTSTRASQRSAADGNPGGLRYRRPISAVPGPRSPQVSHDSPTCHC